MVELCDYVELFYNERRRTWPSARSVRRSSNGELFMRRSYTSTKPDHAQSAI